MFFWQSARRVGETTVGRDMGNRKIISLSEAVSMGFKPKWTVSAEGDIVLSQPGFGRVRRVVVVENGVLHHDRWIFDHQDGAVCAPIEQSKYLGLVLNWRPTVPSGMIGDIPDLSCVGSLCWELPQGLCLPGEKPEDTALREGQEETGVPLKDPELLGYFRNFTGFLPKATPLFVAYEDVGRERTEIDRDEGIEKVGFFSPREIGTMLDSGELESGSTLAALLHLSRRGFFRLEV